MSERRKSVHLGMNPITDNYGVVETNPTKEVSEQLCLLQKQLLKHPRDGERVKYYLQIYPE